MLDIEMVHPYGVCSPHFGDHLAWTGASRVVFVGILSVFTMGQLTQAQTALFYWKTSKSQAPKKD